MPSMHPNKLHKRNNPSRTGSELSCSSASASCCTFVYDELFNTPPEKKPKKPWAIKALRQLGLMRKRSSGKKKGSSETRNDEELYTSPYGPKEVPFVLLIDKESVERTKARQALEDESRDLLPEHPAHMLMKAPSSNALSRLHTPRPRRPLQGGSTPDLLLHANRDSADDPFFLEKYLDQFPTPPALPGQVVRCREEYTARQPVKPGIRRRDSNASFSMPTPRAYPNMQFQKTSINWLDRKVPKGSAIYGHPPTFTVKNSSQIWSSESKVALPRASKKPLPPLPPQ
ncbi:hypothetical protein DFH11DRAFT_1540170 [Phellopilus nigrolimitatus]|nr:hypothetical protein DFH11DRAFT_1540170 [Phellopilus nigrolimitatus]